MAKQDRPSRPAEPASREGPPPISRRGWLLLILAAILPVAVHVAFFKADVPLGKPGTITYPYSDFAPIRAERVPQMIAIAAILGAAVLLAADPPRRRRAVAYGLAVVGVIGVGVWALVSPPAWQRQHLFNLLSPSHDGAFFLEAEHVKRVGVAEYVRTFPDRAATPPEEMRGTRVISNPPGTTLLVIAIDRALTAGGALERWFGQWAVDDPTLPVEVKRRAGHALAFSLALIGFWFAGAVLIFVAGRTLVAPETALAIAIVAAVSPMTVAFTPGKDPAQLATVGAFLCPWLGALRCRGAWRLVFGLVAGVMLALGGFVGLIHFWIGGAVILASWLAAWRCRSRSAATSPGGLGPGAMTATLAAAAGFGLGAALLTWTLGYDMLASTLAIARAQAQVTRGPTAMPLTWQALGLPLFVLFAGVGVLAAAGMVIPRSRDSATDVFGRRLLLVTLSIMLLTVGFTNVETPRLWIPFAALLAFGAGLRLEALLPAGRARARLLAAIVALQVVAAAVQWSLMDMREAELRLKVDETGGARFFD
ncbi:MAG: hypothetical protein IT450_06975 [Phycisphaerales bacterium]|nr:hypothetical protein [Phycisphaerales bacterium]